VTHIDEEDAVGITGALASMTVSDLDRAEAWYTALFGRGPDARPMTGLLEWHTGAGAGVQVWLEPGRAGGSGATLATDDLDAVAGAVHDGPTAATSSRILQLADPDGNRVVLTGR
jgi:predicted enzyme related to lactoylglutathione lyase